MLQPGDIVKRKYRLVRFAGEGGMGSVWEGVHETIQKKVAIKFLHSGLSGDATSFSRFVKEAQIASSIGHRSIIEIFDMDIMEDGTPFMVMEYLDGRSLQSYLDEKKRISTAETIEIVLPLLQALELTHRKGIVHRDLKPDNVFICDMEGAREIKILDFGISKVAKKMDRAMLTQSGSAMGTPFYMSPEQARGEKELDRRVDIFAIGVLCYRCISGRLPFDGENSDLLTYPLSRNVRF